MYRVKWKTGGGPNEDGAEEGLNNAQWQIEGDHERGDEEWGLGIMGER